jgi:hypothetical protein
MFAALSGIALPLVESLTMAEQRAHAFTIGSSTTGTTAAP